jgi:hypothetical protein
VIEGSLALENHPGKREIVLDGTPRAIARNRTQRA